jgi:hypothetical protein
MNDVSEGPKVEDTHDDAPFSNLIRAGLAIVLTVSLPVVLLIGTTDNTDVVQTYLDALAAVVAFYFGASAATEGNG